MKRSAGWLGAILLAAVVLSLAYASWKASRSAREHFCAACQRPIHDRARTVALAASRRQQFCCPACALTAGHQTGAAVRIIELTDYETGVAVNPAEAYIVRDSDVNLCMQSHGPVDQDKQPTVTHFDRCTPSLIAFARLEAAARFLTGHGGRIVRFSNLAATLGE